MPLYRYTYRIRLDDDRTPEIVLNVYSIIKETPRTYEISVDSKKKRIYKGAKNSFAYETKERALESFIIKKKHQIAILKRNLRIIKQARNIAKQIII